MSFSSVINLGTVSPAITKVKLSACTGSTCDNPVVITGYDNYDVWSGTKTISGIPDTTNYVKVEALDTSCVGITQCLQISGKPGTPTPTPTATPTPTIGSPTPTPTATPTPYYLLLSRCDAAPGTITGWTANAYTQSQMQITDIFWSAGGYYYSVINYQQAPPSPVGTIEGSKNVSGFTSCSQTPDAYVEPPATPGVGFLVYTGGTFNDSSTPCSTYESELIDQTATVFLSGHTIPAVDDYVYTTNVCVTTFVGNSTYYWAFANGKKYALVIGSSGQISEATPCGPTATFSTSTITAARQGGTAGTTTETSGTTITVVNGTVTIKLKTWVVTGYRSDTTITVNGSSISPEFAGQGATPLTGTGEGNASFATFTLPVGVYTVTDWTVSAISDGTQTVVQAKLEQV
jgi:hypothetical protein